MSARSGSISLTHRPSPPASLDVPADGIADQVHRVADRNERQFSHVHDCPRPLHFRAAEPLADVVEQPRVVRSEPVDLFTAVAPQQRDRHPIVFPATITTRRRRSPPSAEVLRPDRYACFYDSTSMSAQHRLDRLAGLRHRSRRRRAGAGRPAVATRVSARVTPASTAGCGTSPRRLS